jgi:hypothetical protein
MANITTTEAADVIPTIVAAQALGYLRANIVLARLVARDWDDEVASYGQTVKVPLRGALSVNDKAANTVVTLQNPSTTTLNVTLNKHKEVSFLIEDLAKALARPEMIQGYMQDGIAVIAEQIDSDLASLYSGFSQSLDATAGAGGLGEGTFREARRLLNSAKVPLGGRWAVLHEDAEAEYLGVERFINRDYAETLGGAMANAYTGRAMGFDVYLDQKITVATSECKNLFGHRNAAVLATRPMPQAEAGIGVRQVSMSEEGVGLRVTMSYNPDHLGYQVTIDVLYGFAEQRDNHAVVVRTTEA